MKVKYFHEQPGVSTGNIIWCERDRGSQYYRVSRYVTRNGKFTADHPAAPGSDRANEKAEFGDSEKMAEFRARGYWASCFPEGDGITLKCERGQSKERVMDDIRAVIKETGTRDGFKVFDPRVRRAMTFDEVRETEDDPPEKHWPERWKRRLDA